MTNLSPAKARFLQIQTLLRAGELEKAEKEVSSALKTGSKDPNFIHLGGHIAELQGNFPRALMLYRRALKVHPNWMEAEYNLARMLAATGEVKEALALMEKVVQKRNDIPQIYETLAKLRQRAKDLKGAIAAWEKACALAPANETYRSFEALLRAQVCDWTHPAPTLPLLPQATLVFRDDPAEQKAAAERAATHLFGRIAPLPPPPAWPHERLRIGYLSGDYQAHATAWLCAELFELHDKTRFEVFAYSTSPSDGSEIRKRIETSAEHFVNLETLRPQAAAERIRQDECDILIDLKGYTRGNRLEILAYRPAPLQLHWLGFPATLGTRFIDYYIGDSVALPATLEPFFTEKVVRLPDSYQINDRKRAIDAPKSRASYGLPEKGVVLASFNQTYKITPELFDVWAKILKNNPESTLWLLESNAEAAQALRTEAENRGLSPSRLVFAKPCAQAEHLARYKVVDLALDTFPVGGHTTTSDALWAGTPVVTLMGRSFVSRVASSLLCATGLSSLVTQDLESYQEKIERLVAIPQERAALKQTLLRAHDTAPLFDTPRFVKALEEAFLSLRKDEA